jgi:hypothetical protein
MKLGNLEKVKIDQGLYICLSVRWIILRQEEGWEFFCSLAEIIDLIEKAINVKMRVHFLQVDLKNVFWISKIMILQNLYFIQEDGSP